MLSEYAEEEIKVSNTMRAYRQGFYTSQKAAAIGCSAKPACVRAYLSGTQLWMDRPEANKLLTAAEASLVLWLDRNIILHLRITKQMIVNECNYILVQRIPTNYNPAVDNPPPPPPRTCANYDPAVDNPPPPPLRTCANYDPAVDNNPPPPPRTCGEHWVLHFLKSHLEFVVRIDNLKELAREAAEDWVSLGLWFELLEHYITAYGVQTCNIYNYDETGIMLGIGKKEKVIVEATRGWVESSTTTNCESCMLGECISADGDVVPLLLILKGKTHQACWYTQSSIPDDYIIEVNETAYMNDQLAFQWIQYFAAWSEK
jgi:hypothetical protein